MKRYKEKCLPRKNGRRKGRKNNKKKKERKFKMGTKK